MTTALVLKAPGLITNPGENPRLPDLIPGLLFTYDASRLTLNDGEDVTVWPSVVGPWPGALTQSSSPSPTFAGGTIPSVSFDACSLTSSRPDTVPNDLLTVAALVYIPALVGDQTIVGTGRPFAQGFTYLRVMESGLLSIGIKGEAGSPSQRNTSAAVVPTGRWAFVCGVFNGQDSRVYVDTTRKDVEFIPGGGVWPSVRLGADSSEEPSNYFVGNLAIASAFSRALSENEVKALRGYWLAARGLQA